MNHAGEYVFARRLVVAVQKKRVESKLLYNFGVEDDESYVLASGAVVHNCRGTWHAEPETPPGVSPQFSGWLESVMAQGRVKP